MVARIREGILVNTAFNPNVKPATMLPREASSPRPLDGAGVGPSFTAASSVAAVAAAITTAAAVASVSDSLVGTSDLIGRFVRKLFGEDLCEGRLASLDASTRFYLVEYEDGDAEEL
jgi:acyl-coenzyme A thioesterase PaaI-like protein